jgi:hypothetical protein
MAVFWHHHERQIWGKAGSQPRGPPRAPTIGAVRLSAAERPCSIRRRATAPASENRIVIAATPH